MFITRIFPKKIVAKMIEKKNQKMIHEYTTVSDFLEPKFAQRINENIDSIARYAKRKDCHLEFVPAEDLFQNSIQMNVYKKGVSILRNDDGLPFMAFDLKSLSGQSVLPEDAKGIDLISYIRKVVKCIINNDKNWGNKISELQIKEEPKAKKIMDIA